MHVRSHNIKRIVMIGGGTGTCTLLSALKHYPTENSVIVTTSDDGSSTGRLRDELGVMPMGDIRQCMSGLSNVEKTILDMFSYRFENGALKGHTPGNIILAALEKVSGGIEPAIAACARMLDVRGDVVPVTLFPTVLTAILENGQKIVGEHCIDEPKHSGELHIQKMKLEPSGNANPKALQLIKEADLIVFGPGDVFTSTVPNLLVKGMVQAIKKSSAKKILITNLMTKFGQTNGMNAFDITQILASYLGKGVLSAVLVNTKRPTPAWIARYKKEKSEFIDPAQALFREHKIEVFARPLLSKDIFQKSSADPLRRSYLRHDSDLTAKFLLEYLESHNTEAHNT